jgi:hypothetical protein
VDFKKGKSKAIRVNSLNELVKARAFITGCLADQGVISNKNFGGAQVPLRVWVDAE